MEGIAARTSQGNVLTSQRSPIGDKRLSTRIESFQVLDSSRRRSAGQSRNSKPELRARRSKFVEDRGSVTEGPTDTAAALHQLPVKSRVQNFWQNSPCDSWLTNTIARVHTFAQKRYSRTNRHPASKEIL